MAYGQFGFLGPVTRVETDPLEGVAHAHEDRSQFLAGILDVGLEARSQVLDLQTLEGAQEKNGKDRGFGHVNLGPILPARDSPGPGRPQGTDRDAIRSIVSLQLACVK